MSSFRHCGVGGVTIFLCIFIHDIEEAVSVREETYRKLIRKIDAVLWVEERCDVGCTGPTSDDAGIEDVREISTHPSRSQPQEKFRVPCVFRSMGWKVRRLNSGEIAGSMDLPVFKGG